MKWRAKSGVYLLVGSVALIGTSAHAQEATLPAGEPAPPPPAAEDPPGAVEPPPPSPPAPPSLPALAPATPRFGEAGVYVVTAASVVGLSAQSFAKSTTETFSAAFSPGLDVFLVRGFSIGVDLDLRYDVTSRPPNAALGTTKRTTFAAGPRFGFNLPLGAHLSLYPRATVGFASVSTTTELTAMPEQSDSERSIYVQAFVPLLFHAAPHFFFGAGPSFSHRFAEAGNTGEVTSIAGRILIGGWWGGEAKGEPAAAAGLNAVAAETPRFGSRGQWVFTGDVGGRAAYSGGSSSSTIDGARTDVSLTPGVDVFLFDHVSLGGALAFGYASTDTTTRTTIGLGPRVGVEIPLGRSFSLYPRAIVSYVHAVTDVAVASRPYGATVGGATTSSSGDIFTLGAYAPVLFHVAPHFFLGFGPSLVQELSRQFGTDSGNLGRRIGAELEVGGWL